MKIKYVKFLTLYQVEDKSIYATICAETVSSILFDGAIPDKFTVDISKRRRKKDRYVLMSNKNDTFTCKMLGTLFNIRVEFTFGTREFVLSQLSKTGRLYFHVYDISTQNPT